MFQTASLLNLTSVKLCLCQAAGVSVLVHLFCARAETGVCNKLLRLGFQLPEAWQVSVKDPKLMAWLHEPQLMQRDEKQIEGYTLQALLLTTPHALPYTVPNNHPHYSSACLDNLLCM